VIKYLILYMHTYFTVLISMFVKIQSFGFNIRYNI